MYLLSKSRAILLISVPRHTREVDFKKSQQSAGGLSLPRSSPASKTSLEEYRKHRDSTLDERRSVGGSSGSFRKAKSEPDVAIQSMKKKVEVS